MSKDKETEYGISDREERDAIHSEELMKAWLASQKVWIPSKPIDIKKPPIKSVKKLTSPGKEKV